MAPRLDTKWLEKHGGQWRVSIAVPRALHKSMGTRLKKPLHTDSLAFANRLKLTVVRELREKIERAQEMAGLKYRPAIAEALEIAPYFSEPLNKDAEEDLLRLIAEKATEIQGPETGNVYTEDGDIVPLYDPVRSALAEDFKAVATGRATPLNTYHTDYMSKSNVAARTRADDVRAIKYLTNWCTKNSIPLTLQGITPKIAVRFMDDFGQFSGGLDPATQNKYLSRLRRYWAFMLSIRVQVRPRHRVQSRPLGGVRNGVVKAA